MRVVPTVNISCVKPYKGPLPGQRIDRPKLVVFTQEGEEEFEIEQVVDARLKHGKLEFLVLWKGYGDGDRMWEPKAHLDNFCLQIKNPSAPRKLRGIDSNLFNSLFQPMPKNLTTTSGTWSRALEGG
ncbi:hypothetical protein SERLA73DRAFT_72392 [Serpula lacrymans var. lacrymans S7.3]|uniref:Chromo domain-containing protein n=1 Tax=Serpula lacrymans var. lacrymans (strain S7.3) TaxID=936435 RepID=F8PVY6_SERL3|nr:hypothetical protein SERLA73DRAFT_72392 [Serpula lacrymans var. lacrymans S7.3]